MPAYPDDSLAPVSRPGGGPGSVAPLPDFGASWELLRRAQDGDRSAVNALIERYYDRVYRIVRIRMSARLRGALESVDIVQNTFVKAAEKLPGFEPRDHSSLIRWLATLAEHQIHDARDRMEAERRNPDREVRLAPTDDGGDSGPIPPARTPSPSTIASQSELKEIYDACVEALPDRYREVVLLVEYADTPWEIVRKEIDVPTVSAASEMYRRAQVKLAKLLRARIRT